MNAKSNPPAKPRTRGPVDLAFSTVFGLVGVTLSAWVIGCLIEIGGGYLLWKGQGIHHAQSIVQQDLQYIAAAPRSLLVQDTVAFSHQVATWVRWPYERLGVLRFYLQMRTKPQLQQTAAAPSQAQLQGMRNATKDMLLVLSEWLVVSMFVAQDVLLRLCIAAFAMPAFALACLLGVIDGLVRRDIRRWTGGRESSFVYHHAKRYTAWAITGGFGLYLSWPFGGFNPAYMVMVFTVLVAASLSTTVASFKKYA
ncbi:TIGR03747 family integrating conjugative element membrane protein [Comamonas sp.]|uniref:TIGR03747 family integrating conjugative element membrane protein n=1 Tax=Comamonas sp. TaxID=34028 RepID=UPI00258F7302|nr:TIGR03747 family integrating conjugative element membrane protein [Comamonas sp.]